MSSVLLQRRQARPGIQTVTVDISDLKMSQDANDILVTYSLGSCVGLALYDKVAKVGGLIHCMLPLSKIDKDKAAFLALIAERYFSCTTKAIRAIDPDHLILGCRFAGGRTTADVWAAAAKHCDVLTLNYYGNVDLDREIAIDDL